MSKKYRWKSSIGGMIWVVFGFCLCMLLALLSLHFFSYVRSSEITERAHFEKLWTEYAKELCSDMDAANNTLLWAAGSMENDDLKNENPYRRLMITSYTSDLLRNVTEQEGVIDAVLVSLHDSDVLLETHFMEDAAFLRLVERYGSRKAERMAAPILFGLDENAPSHILMQTEAIVYNPSIGNNQNVALVTIAIRLDVLLGDGLADNGAVLLCRKNGEQLIPCYGIGTQTWGLDASFSYSDLLEEETLQYQNVAYMTATAPLGYGNFYIVALQPMGTLWQQTDLLSMRSFLVTLSIVSLTALGIMFIIRQVHRATRKMTRDIGRISAGEYTYRLNKRSLSEFDSIAQTMNHLLDELYHSNTRKAEMQEELFNKKILLLERQNLALQAQINPHFLYNTLECIQSIALCSGVEEIPVIVNAMSTIYRYSVGGSQMGTVEEELTCARLYVDIMRIRFGDCFEVTFEEPEDCKPLLVPRMTVQPILENAFIHGILKSEKDSKRISLRCFKKDDRLHIAVMDNGAGISLKKLGKIRSVLENGDTTVTMGHGIGLRNIHLRLSNIYGENRGLQITSQAGEFTCVEMEVPVLHKAENETKGEQNEE